MQKKLTITINEKIYDGLHRVCPACGGRGVIGHHHISRFIEDLVRPYVLHQDFEAVYEEMAQDKAREVDALEWSDITIGDVTFEFTTYRRLYHDTDSIRPSHRQSDVAGTARHHPPGRP